jgi:hypothetical protein
MKKLIVYGDQLIAGSGPHDGYNVEPGNHWWELLANELGREAVNLSSPKKCTGISPLFYCSQLVKQNINPDDFFIGVLPSAERSMTFVGNKVKHNITIDAGPHHNDSFRIWQRETAIRILELWSTQNNSFFFIMGSDGDMYDPVSEKMYVLPQVGRFDMNHFWSWVMLEHPDLTHPTHFYKNCAPDRKLNSYGHKCVYEVVRKYIIR